MLETDCHRLRVFSAQTRPGIDRHFSPITKSPTEPRVYGEVCGGAVDHPRVSGGLRVHVNRSQIVRLLNPRPDVERYGVEYLLALGLHRLLGRGVAWPTTGMSLVVHLVRIGHDAYSFLPLFCAAGDPFCPSP